MAEPQGRECVVEGVVVAVQLNGRTYFVQRKAIKEGKGIHRVDVHLFIAGFFRSMSGENKMLADFFHTLGFGE